MAALFCATLALSILAAQRPECEAFLGDQPDIMDVLGPLLSPNASIYLPGSEGFANGTVRWSALDNPDIAAVVKVAVEEDVQQTESSQSFTTSWADSAVLTCHYRSSLRMRIVFLFSPRVVGMAQIRILQGRSTPYTSGPEEWPI
jgi:hypothetical protein